MTSQTAVWTWCFAWALQQFPSFREPSWFAKWCFMKLNSVTALSRNHILLKGTFCAWRPPLRTGNTSRYTLFSLDFPWWPRKLCVHWISLWACSWTQMQSPSPSSGWLLWLGKHWEASLKTFLSDGSCARINHLVMVGYSASHFCNLQLNWSDISIRLFAFFCLKALAEAA